MEITNLRTFEVKFIGPSNFRPARLRITDTRNNVSIIETYRYEAPRAEYQAIDTLKGMGIEIESFSWNEKTGRHFLHTRDFATPLKK